MHEYVITTNSDRNKYRKLAEAIEAAGGEIVSEDDYEQFEYPLEQMYIDYMWQGKSITLHLEHSLGIMLLSKDVVLSALKAIADIIQKI
jgi:hypothetical protein